MSGTVLLQRVCDDFLSLDDLSPWGLAERLRENLFVEGVLTRLLMVVHVHALSPRGHDPHGGGPLPTAPPAHDPHGTHMTTTSWVRAILDEGELWNYLSGIT